MVCCQLYMPSGLFVRIADLASGGNLRKSKSDDYRFEFGVAFLACALACVGAEFGRPYLDQASATFLGLAILAYGLTVVVGAWLWARLVPAGISLFLSIIVAAFAVWGCWAR